MSLYGQIVSKGIKPTVSTYNTLLTGRLQAIKTRDTRNLLDEMKLNKVVPDSWIYTNFIDSFCKNDCLLQAFELFYSLENYSFKLNIEILVAFLMD